MPAPVQRKPGRHTTFQKTTLNADKDLTIDELKEKHLPLFSGFIKRVYNNSEYRIVWH
jgi:hypothetical protein